MRVQLGIKPDEIVFASIGRVVGWKGFSLVVKVLLEFKDAKYILCGDGDELDNLKDLAKEIGVFERIYFIGEVKHQDLNKFINASDIYIQPSIGHEAFGITVIEALSCNKVCVVSDNGGMRDIIRDGINGFKFKISDINDLKDKIDVALSKKHILEPRKSIEGLYEWSSFSNEIVKDFL
nr:glycosyltransferase [Campylobacter mucosalis]